MGTTYRSITQHEDPTAIAEAIYDHLANNPKDVPTGDAPALAFTVSSKHAACVLLEQVGHQLLVSPATACAIQVDRNWHPSYLWPRSGVRINYPGDIGPTENVRRRMVNRIRVAVTRTMDEHQLELDRIAARIRQREAEADADAAACTCQCSCGATP